MTSTKTDFGPGARDYERVGQAIEFLAENAQSQPTLDNVAAKMGLSPAHAQRVFQRWAGISPKQFLSFVTHQTARALLGNAITVLDTTYETGLSGPGRLHDLCLKWEAMTPGELRAGGATLQLNYGFHDSPFGIALIVTSPRGLAGLAFADTGNRDEVLADMAARWPRATLRHDQNSTKTLAKQIFADRQGDISLTCWGTPFQRRVWEALLRIPQGRVTTYGDLAAHLGMPKAARAIGTAVGRNPISYLIPCHRVLRRSGALGGYHWGLQRKRAMLLHESAQLNGRIEGPIGAHHALTA